jgi:hypothetical protein
VSPQFSMTAAAEVAERLSAPSGFQVEVGYGARGVGPDWDENRAYDSISMWGHQPVTRSV